MNLWKVTTEVGNAAHRVTAGEQIVFEMGTWPIEPDQSVWIEYRVQHLDGTHDGGKAEAIWQRNDSVNNYWEARIGPFAGGDRVTCKTGAISTNNEVEGFASDFEVKPRIYLALLWHQHQPMYKDTSKSTAKGSYIHPWVRLHAIRDYYSMAALVSEHPDVHLTINLTPCLLWQIEDYLQNGATDRALDLTLKPAETLSSEEREHVLSRSFDAHLHNQIFPHARFKELFIQRSEKRPFSDRDLRDLQMWSNLAWFGKEFREGELTLPTGESASVQRMIHKGRNFTQADIESMVKEQYKIMRAVVPLHRELQDRGQIEVSTTPFYHPILPLLIDSDRATIDRPGTSSPRRFAHPEDADAQVRLAMEYYHRQFGRAPRGMWPAEGAVSQFAIPFFAGQLRWIATDRGVLAKSGRWGYEVGNPDVVCKPYRAEEAGDLISIFFRDTQLSDRIGFHYQDYSDYQEAAQAFLREIKERFALRVTSDRDHVLTVVLDGENAWGAYRDDGRPFLNALYDLIERDHEVQTVTFSEYLEGSRERCVAPHRQEDQPKVYDLFTGSWIDENGSAPGVDLGTWIGEKEENKAWDLLSSARDFLIGTGATPETSPAAFEALYMAEGSDWFWWFGEDQDSGNDEEFDDLFRTHLKNIYRRAGAVPPAGLDHHIVPHVATWSFTQQTARVDRHDDRLTVQTNCPGILTWRFDDGAEQASVMLAVGGVMAGIQRYQLTLGPFPSGAQELRFSFRCTYQGCDGREICCRGDEYAVGIF